MSEDISVENLINLVMIDQKRKVRIQIILERENGDQVDIQDTVTALAQFVTKQLEKEGSQCNKQVYPLMAQSLVAGLVPLLGPGMSAFLISDEATKYSLVHAMSVGFYLMKWLQQKNIVIKTVEYPMTDEEIDEVKRMTARDSTLTRAIVEGKDPKTTIREMIKAGLLTREEVEAIGQDDDPDEEVVN